MLLSGASSTMEKDGDRRITKRPNMNNVMKDELDQDMISNLPSAILIIILSKLRIDEAVRCGILSKRWLRLWKQTSHLEFDLKYTVKPLQQVLLSRKPRVVPDLNTYDPSLYKLVYACYAKVTQLILGHWGIISSCRIRHFRKNIGLGDVTDWVVCLIDSKEVKDLSLECAPDSRETDESIAFREDVYLIDFPDGIFKTLDSLELINYTMYWWQPFQECCKLKKLKLKRVCLDDETLNGILQNCVVLENFSLLESSGFEELVIEKSKLKVLQLQALFVDEIDISCENLEILLLDSMICEVKNVRIYAPCLRTFRSYCYSIYARMLSVKGGKSIVKTHDILATLSGYLARAPSCNIFQNLSTLSIDLDLNKISEATILSYVLNLCTSLQAIEITLPVFMPRNFVYNSNISHPMSKFWDKRKLCYCTSQKLKFVYMRGFKGNVQEVEFAKYLITRATMLKRITIICSDSMEVAENLLSLPRASATLSINLKLNANNPMDEFAEHQNRQLKW
ncbi:hypothetical protein VNO77_28020 [Canavalia gladiata]|uniref:FBD domain-containing protein n=1 Tax=Canavalia gladiata TaxID=3824 RepID=A0AAN9KV72_CANGL